MSGTKPKPGSKAARRQSEQQSRRKDMIRVGIAIVVLIAAAWFLLKPKSGPPIGAAPAGSVHIATSSGHTLGPGDTVPEFSAPLLGGGTMDWTNYAGKPVVLAIWASWCPHCQKELPILASTQGAHPSVTLVTVTTDFGAEPGPTPAEYMRQHNLSFPVGLDDAQNTLLKGLGVQSFPTVYYVGSDGKIAETTAGEVDPATIDKYFSTLH
jgi:thiol-disulfide isomerase/thioredoxin